MAFYCPECNTKSLKIVTKIELPADSRSDEIAVQTLRCGRCRFAAMAVYEESRRGALGDESIEHRGYHLSSSELRDLRKDIKQCPEPRNPHCHCAIHQKLGARNEAGRWSALQHLRSHDSFELRL
jgi:hypothetical protein